MRFTAKRNGANLKDFRLLNYLLKYNSFFQHKIKHVFTREMPKRQEKSIMDNIIIESKNIYKLIDKRRYLLT